MEIHNIHRNPRWLTGLTLKTLLFGTLISTASTSLAIGITDEKFTDLAGELSADETAVNLAYGQLNEASLASHFNPVGMLLAGNLRCTATWLGSEEDSAYIVTAAHCVYGDNKSEESRYIGERATFRTGDGRILAHGIATTNFAGYTQCSNDIAVVELPLIANPIDSNGQLVPKPVFADQPEFTGFQYQPMTLAGYGYWGTPTLGNLGWGRAFGQGGIPLDFGGCLLNQADSEEAWAFGAPGDSGSASWHWRDGQFIATGIASRWLGWAGRSSLHTRIAPHHQWLKRVYPQINTVTRSRTLTESSPIELGSVERSVKGSVYYNAGDNTLGPRDSQWDYPSGFTYLGVYLTDQSERTSRLVILRAQRLTHCGWGEINNGVYCRGGANKGDLKVWFEHEDNAGLVPGLYQGTFTLEAKGWHDESYQSSIALKANILVEGNRGIEGTVTETKATRTIPYDSTVRGTIYYQAHGSTKSDTGGPVWNGEGGRWSTLDVLVRNRDTKEAHSVKLRASRLASGCMWVTMNNAVSCQGDEQGSYGQLDISYHESDNPDLPDGRYESYFNLKAIGWHTNFHKVLTFRVDVNKGG